MSTATLVARRRAALRSRGELIHFWLGRLAIVVGLLVFMGLIASFSTTVYYRIALDRPPYDDFIQHVLFLLGGVLLAVLVVVFAVLSGQVSRWLRFVIPLVFYISIVLVALVRFSPWGVTCMGATRGLDIGLFTFQPSELLKISLVLYLAQLLCWWRRPSGQRASRHSRRDIAARKREAASRHSGEVRWPISLRLLRDARPIWPELPKRCILIILMAAGLTIIQPDLGSTAIILGASFITLILAGADWRHMLGFIMLLVLIGVAAYLAAPDHYEYASQRIETWLHPGVGQDGPAYQLTQARGAMVAGGLLGRGFLESDQKMNRLPLSTKDFVFPVMVEELGYAGGLAIILLFAGLAWVGCRLSQYCRDPFNRTVIAALAFTICLQGLVNIGTTTGALPLSGLTLPFFSEGGTSLVVTLMAVGLMAALALSDVKLGEEGMNQEEAGCKQ